MCAMSTLTVLYFYPRPPRGGRHYFPLRNGVVIAISIHALREEGDQRCDTIYRAEDDFYPRPP